MIESRIVASFAPLSLFTMVDMNQKGTGHPMLLAPPELVPLTRATIIKVSQVSFDILEIHGVVPTVSANRTHSSTPLTNVSSAAGRIS